MTTRTFKVQGTITMNFTKIVTVREDLEDLEADSYEDEIQDAFDRGEEYVEGFDMSEPVEEPEIHSIEEAE